MCTYSYVSNGCLCCVRVYPVHISYEYVYMNTYIPIYTCIYTYIPVYIYTAPQQVVPFMSTPINMHRYMHICKRHIQQYPHYECHTYAYARIRGTATATAISVFFCVCEFVCELTTTPSLGVSPILFPCSIHLSLSLFVCVRVRVCVCVWVCICVRVCM